MNAQGTAEKEKVPENILGYIFITILARKYGVLQKASD